MRLAKGYLWLLCSLLSFSLAAAPTDKGFLWKVSADDATVFLMGSLHFATTDFYPLRPAVLAAFNDSDALVVEIDIAAQNPLQLQQLVMETGTYANGTTLRSQLSDKAWQRLGDYMQQKGLSLANFNSYRPGLLITTLTSLEIMEEGLSAESGLDLYFLNQARGKKNIMELETLQQQLSLLMDIDDPDELMLQTLDEFDNYGQMISDLISIWQTGDEDALTEMMITEPLEEYPESKDYFDRIYTERNQAMAAKVKSMLQQGGDYFVVVGAGHLIGETGLVELLEQSGYQVTRQ